MVAGIPVLSPREVERRLVNLGFAMRAGKGAHRFYQHPDGRTTTLPFHAGRDIPPGLLRKVCADIQMSVQEFVK